MAIMSQQMSPEMLTAMLSDPRAQPAQRMAAMNMLNQMKGGAGAPESKMSDSAIMDWNAKRGNTPFADYKPSMADPTQGDGTGAGDMDPSFIRAVQREMQGEQAPQGLPPAQGQQMAQAPQDQGVQGDIAAGVEAASGFAQGGAVRGYQVGGDVLRVGNGRLSYDLSGLRNADPVTTSNPMFPRLTTSDVISGNLGPSVLGSAPQTEPADEDSKYGAMFEDAGKKYLESSADETTPEDDRNSALLKFGLGMMTSASKPGATFLGAAGEGGLNAVSEFEKARASRAENRMKKLGLIGNLAEREETRKDRVAAAAQRHEEFKIRMDEAAKTARNQERLEQAGLDIKERLGLDSNEFKKAMFEWNQQRVEDKRISDADKAPKGVQAAPIEIAESAGVPVDLGPYAGLGKEAQEKLAIQNSRQYESNVQKNIPLTNKRQELLSNISRYRDLNKEISPGVYETNTGPIIGNTPGSSVINEKRQEMASISAKLASGMREIGSGNTSDYDAKKLEQVVPSTTLDNAVSANRIKAIDAIIRLQDEKQEFIDNFYSVNRHTGGAEKYWKKYLNENPVLGPDDKNGNITLNQNRKSYKEYFYGDKAGDADPLAVDPLGFRAK